MNSLNCYDFSLMVIFGGRSDFSTGGQWAPQPPHFGPDYYRWGPGPGLCSYLCCCSNRVSYYDTATSTWYSPNIVGPQVVVISVLTNTELNCAVQPEGRRSHSAVSLQSGRLIIFGGYNGATKEHKDDLWQLDCETWRWTRLNPHGSGPNPRRRQALVKVSQSSPP